LSDLALKQGDTTRHVAIVSPPDIAAAERLPLVVLLHGHSESSGLVVNQGDWKTHVIADRFIVAAPEGISQSWNAGGCCRLATTLSIRDVEFLDADDLHPASNRAKMSAGTPLTDDDRMPWLDRVSDELAARSASGAVIACDVVWAEIAGWLDDDAIRHALVDLVGVDLALDRMDVGDGGEVEVLAPDVGLQFGQEGRRRVQVPGAGAGLDEGRPFPVLADRLVVLQRRGRRHRERCRRRVGPQPEVQAEDVAVAGLQLHQFRHPGGQPHRESKRFNPLGDR
jgi:hypothetical protein